MNHLDFSAVGATTPKTESVVEPVTLNGETFEKWETMTFDDINEEEDYFFDFIPRGCRDSDGEKYRLNCECNDEAYQAYLERKNKWYKAFECAVEAEGITGLRDREFFLMKFKPMEYK